MGEDSNVAPNFSDVKIYVCTTDEYGKQDYKELDTVATSEIKAESEDAEQNDYSISMDQKSYYASIEFSAEVDVRDLAQAIQELAMDAEKAAVMAEKLGNMSREWAYEQKQWVMQGWGYTPKLHSSAQKPHRAKPYWHRTRSFCVRRGYH